MTDYVQMCRCEDGEIISRRRYENVKMRRWVNYSLTDLQMCKCVNVQMSKLTANVSV